MGWYISLTHLKHCLTKKIMACTLSPRFVLSLGLESWQLKNLLTLHKEWYLLEVNLSLTGYVSEKATGCFELTASLESWWSKDAGDKAYTEPCVFVSTAFFISSFFFFSALFCLRKSVRFPSTLFYLLLWHVCKAEGVS